MNWTGHVLSCSWELIKCNMPRDYLFARIVPQEFHAGVELDRCGAVELQDAPLHELHGRVFRKQLELIKPQSCWVLRTWTFQHFSHSWSAIFQLWHLFKLK